LCVGSRPTSHALMIGRELSERPVLIPVGLQQMFALCRGRLGGNQEPRESDHCEDKSYAFHRCDWLACSLCERIAHSLFLNTQARGKVSNESILSAEDFDTIDVVQSGDQSPSVKVICHPYQQLVVPRAQWEREAAIFERTPSLGRFHDWLVEKVFIHVEKPAVDKHPYFIAPTEIYFFDLCQRRFERGLEPHRPARGALAKQP